MHAERAGKRAQIFLKIFVDIGVIMLMILIYETLKIRRRASRRNAEIAACQRKASVVDFGFRTF